MAGTKTQIIVLAAGKGKRMQTDLPKVLVKLKGKPIIKHLLESIGQSGVCSKPVLVVGQKREMVMSELGDNYYYAIQEDQLGTGHAVNCASLHCSEADQVLVLYGDHPHVSADTIKNIADNHTSHKNILTIATVEVLDFHDWRAGFFDFGRIVRDENNKIIKIVEKKDATENELIIREVNPAYFCFNAKWLFKNLPTLKNQNAQGEYYLTDLIGLAQHQGHEINSIKIEPHEALGVNTPEQLALLEQDLLF